MEWAIIINGFVKGSVYSILAFGFTLIFGIAKIINLAHTAFYMFAAYLIYIGVIVLGFQTIPSSVLAILIVGGIGIMCYVLFFDRVRENETALIIITLSIAMVLQEILLIVFTGRFRKIPFFVSGSMEIAGVRVLYQHVIIIISSFFILICLWTLLSKTKLGIKIRAVAQDREIANVMGINVGRVCMITMGISAVLAGVAGAVAAPVYPVSPLIWGDLLTVVLSAVILGGLGSLKGSVIAAFLLGFAETIVVFLIPGGSFLKGAVSLSVMVVVLLIRPEGLFGIAFEEERL